MTTTSVSVRMWQIRHIQKALGELNEGKMKLVPHAKVVERLRSWGKVGHRKKTRR